MDESVHKESKQLERDEQRTLILKRSGIREIRFTNEEVLNQTKEVINKIESIL